MLYVIRTYMQEGHTEIDIAIDLDQLIDISRFSLLGNKCPLHIQ